MKFLMAAVVTLGLLTVSAGAKNPEIEKGSVVVVPLDGQVSEAQFLFLRRILKEAEAADASAFILDMDTPGGELSVTEKIIHALLKATMPTYTWVNTNAGSAGALIALGTRHIYMAPVSAIGAAAPVLGTGADIPETMNAKAVSYYSGYFRSVAEQNGYNPNLVDAFMNLNKEVKIGDTVLNPEGAVLTLSAQEAVREYDGRPLLASGIAANIDELKEKAGLHGKTVEIRPSGFEKVAQWITVLAPLFLLAGIVGAYLEFKTPGFGVAGFVSAICFLIFFTGHYIAGLTGLEVVAVFALGLILVIFELMFFPGVLVLSLLGSALMFGALLFAMVDYYPGEPVVPDIEMLARPVMNLGITMVLAILCISLIARFLPDIPLFRRIMLMTSSPSGPSMAIPQDATYDLAVKTGDIGIARSVLRPAGKAQFGAAWVDVVTDGTFVEEGSRIRVTASSPGRVVVESAESADHPA